MTVTSEHIRRPSNNVRSNVVEPNVPPAPPLPPHFEQARNALKSVFGFNQRPEQSRLTANRFARRPDLSSHNAGTSHRTGLKIHAMAINRSGSHVVLAGHEIFKTVRVEAGSATEDLNIRTAIRRFDATAQGTVSTSTSRPRDVIDIKDVAWGKGIYDYYIAAATHNGPIILYDLNRLGAEASRLADHRRQVHRISTNPLVGYLMLSSGQDGLIRVWDIRERNRASGVVSVKSRSVIPSQNECIRDVKWSPTRQTDFAFGTDGGWVKTWDIAMMQHAKVSIPAHSNAVSSVDWHPDGKHVMSASVDKTVRVWNVESDDRRRRDPVAELKAPAAIRMARWRPTCLSASPGDDGLRQSTQIVTIYSTNYPVVHVWDLRRPKLPFRELYPYPKSPTDVLWHSQDLLWTVGAEGTFMQNDLKFTRYTIDKRNLQSLAISPSGELSNYTQTRGIPSRSPRHSSSYRITEVASTERDASTYPQLQDRHSRGSVDDSLDDTFLRLASRSSAFSQGSMTPSHTNADPPVDDCLPLTIALQPTRVSMPTQAASRGPLPGHSSVPRLAYLAVKYKNKPLPLRPVVKDFLRVQEPYLRNAEYAEVVSAYRLAQSWRIVAEIVSREIYAGAVQARRARLSPVFSASAVSTIRAVIKRKALHLLSLAQKERDSKPGSPGSPDMRSDQVTEQPSAVGLAVPETTSNVPTPLARPVASQTDWAAHAMPGSLVTFDPEISFSLPPARSSYLGCPSMSEEHDDYGKGTLPLATVTDSPSLPSISSPTRGAQRPNAAPRIKTQPRQILRLDLDSKVIPPQYSSKHDSEDSFGMFPSFPSSRLESFPESFASSSSRLPMTDNRTDGQRTPFEASTGSSTSPNEQQFGDVGQMSGVDLVGQLKVCTPLLTSQTKLPSSAARPVPDSSATKSLHSNRQSSSDAASALTIDPEADSSHRRRQATSMESLDLQTLQRNNQLSFASDPSVMSNVDGGVADKTGRRSHGMPHTLDGTIAASLHHESSDSSSSRIIGRKATQRDIASEPFVVADFQQQYRVDDFNASPLKMRPMLEALLEYHTQDNIDPQTLTQLIFLVVPVLPESDPLGSDEIDKTLHSYIESLSGLEFSTRQITNIILKTLAHVISAGIQPLQIESILLTYHMQLSKNGLEEHAAYLRRLAYPAYPSVYEQALKDNALHLRCGTCKKPMQFDGGDMQCDECHKKQDPCPICWSRQSPFAVVDSISQRDAGVPEHGREGDNDDDQVKSTNKTRDESQKISADVGHKPSHATQSKARKPTTDAVEYEERQRPIRSPVLLTTCLTCNHAAHSACLSSWHAATRSTLDSRLLGTCPTAGCTCQCLSRREPPVVSCNGLGVSVTAATPSSATSTQGNALPGLGLGGVRGRGSEGLLKASTIRQSLRSSLSLLSPAVSTPMASSNAGWTGGSSAGSSLPFSSTSASGAGSVAVASPLTASSTSTLAFERFGSDRYGDRFGGGGISSAHAGRERLGSAGGPPGPSIGAGLSLGGGGVTIGERRDSDGRLHGGLRAQGDRAVPARSRKSMGSFGQS